VRDQLKQPLAVGMVVLAALVLLTVFGNPAGNARPLVPALVPVFGVPFGAVFALLQLAYCGRLNLKKGFVVVAGVWALAGPLILIGESFGHSPQALAGLARMVTGSACGSAIALGALVLKGKL